MASHGKSQRLLESVDGTGLERQDDLAPLLGITQGHLSKIERGMLPPAAEVLLRLRERFGKTVDWILTGEQ